MLLVLLAPGPARATSLVINNLIEATAVRENFALGDVDGRSYDGPGHHAFTLFQDFASSDLLQIGSFQGAPAGTSLELTVVTALGGYSSGTMGVVNEFGFLDSSDEFSAVFNFDEHSLGSSTVYEQSAGEELTFALNSPESIFSSIDQDNVDGAAHILATSVHQGGRITIDEADMFGNSISFDVQIGDMILFIEDMMAHGNSMDFVADAGDFDYNDLVVVVRATDSVPEPGSLLLLFGALGFGATRKKRQVS